MGLPPKASIRKLGILAGSGALPRQLAAYCSEQRLPYCVIGFEGQAEEVLAQETTSFQWASLSHLGQVVKGLKREGVSHVVLIGSIQRPSFASLVPDLYTLKLLTQLRGKLLGDDGLLRFLVDQLKKEGFTVLGIQDVYGGEELLLPEGPLGQHLPSEALRKEASKIMDLALQFSRTDIGQALVVYDEVIVGAEGLEGTDALLRRCAELRNQHFGVQSGGFLVKVCKPHQDRRVDLPTLGPMTLDLLTKYGYQGLMGQAGSVLVVEGQRCKKMADAQGLFIFGVRV